RDRKTRRHAGTQARSGDEAEGKAADDGVPTSAASCPRASVPQRLLPPIQRDIVFDNVSFTYPGASSPALSGVNLTVTKGMSVAIVGRNGSGKTTLLALLPRFYDVD